MKLVKFAVFGKILLYLVQNFIPAQDLAGKSVYVEKLFSCDLCLGTWLFSLLAYLVGYDAFELGERKSPIRFFLTGAFISFITHLVSIGWRDKFNVIEI